MITKKFDSEIVTMTLEFEQEQLEIFEESRHLVVEITLKSSSRTNRQMADRLQEIQSVRLSLSKILDKICTENWNDILMENSNRSIDQGTTEYSINLDSNSGKKYFLRLAIGGPLKKPTIKDLMEGDNWW